METRSAKRQRLAEKKGWRDSHPTTEEEKEARRHYFITHRKQKKERNEEIENRNIQLVRKNAKLKEENRLIRAQLREKERIISSLQLSPEPPASATSNPTNSNDSSILADFVSKGFEQPWERAYQVALKFLGHGSCKTLLGVDSDRIGQYAEVLGASFDSISFRSMETPKKAKNTENVVERATTMLVVLFLWLKTGTSISLLSFLFEVSRPTIERWLGSSSRLLRHHLAASERWRSEPDAAFWTAEAQKWRPSLPCFMQGAAAIVDGCCFKIATRAPGYWHGHKHAYVRTVLFYVLLSGEIAWWKPSVPGGNDQTVWNIHRMRDDWLNPAYGVIGDGGFTFNRITDKTLCYGLKPHQKKSKKVALKGWKQTENWAISHFRVPIEQTFGRLKQWRILRDRFPFRQDCRTPTVLLDDALHIVVEQVNEEVRRAPWNVPSRNYLSIAKKYHGMPNPEASFLCKECILSLNAANSEYTAFSSDHKMVDI